MSVAVRAAALVVVIALALGESGCGGGPAGGFDRTRLEHDEDLSESLANDLLAFSVRVRDRDLSGSASYIADRIDATPWPTTSSESGLPVMWIERRTWDVAAPAREVPRDEFLADLAAFTGRLQEIDDARFKVKAAEFDSSTRGRASVKFFIVGRDEAYQREWLKGNATIDFARDDAQAEGGWRLTGFALEDLESKVSRVELFSEVALPAGVAATFPAFGVGRNQGFVSHGAAAADVDGDGLVDLVASGVDQNYLYLNLGHGAFRDVSESSLVQFAPRGSGALFVDYDNDGDPDLFFAAVGPQILLENRFVPDGRLEFWDVSERARVDQQAIGFSAQAADINGDGWPDIHVASYNRYGTVMPNSWVQATNGTPNLLFVNQGDGSFREEAAARGVDDGRWSYAAGFVDIDEDGDQDLYVANDFGENALYRNEGGRFADVAQAFGVVDPGFGMGVAFGDYDNDGDLDLHVTNMSSTAGNRILRLLYPEESNSIRQTLGKQAAGNSLYRNDGDGAFREATAEAGGLAGGWAFGGGFIDFDNDGWEDLYTPNGFVSGKTMNDT